MNRANRRLHRRIFLGLTLVLPAALGVALAARTPTPAMEAVPLAMAEPGPVGPPDQVLAWAGLPLRAERWTGAGLVRLSADEPLRVPAPLVYWSAGPPAGGALPPDARLLAPFSDAAPQTLRLPAPGGTLLLYSAADGAVRGALELGE